MSRADQLSSSVVFVCEPMDNGIVRRVDEVSHINTLRIVSAEDTIFALAPAGVYDVFSLTLAVTSQAWSMSAGVAHNLLLSGEGDLFSWGSGRFGELGLGPKNTEMESPGQVRFQTKLTAIASGNYHSCAIDKFGNLYGWGQNFSRQLGLYTKAQSEMSANAVVEDLVMTPRILPFSVQNSVAAVTCGSEFTIALTKVVTIVSFLFLFHPCFIRISFCP